MNADLEHQRLQIDKLMTALVWLHVPIIWVMAFVQASQQILFASIAAGVALVTTVALWFSGAKQFGRIILSAGIMIQISVGVAALQGHPWQIDMHMYYFAALALLVAYLDWRAIIAATLVVAVHHIGLNFLLSEAVYPGGSDIGRLAVHAGILIVEAATLATVSYLGDKLIATLNEQSDRAQIAETESTARAAESDLFVTQLTTALARLSKKDLSCRIVGTIPPSYAGLCKQFNDTLAQLEQVIGSVAQSTGTISSGTDEISAASNDLSRRTESQAASVEETAAALAEITKKVKETAAGAQLARTAVNLAREEARSSNEVVIQAIDAINRIEASSNEISKIINVIEEIAFQTNLLALNAGVEAARAGDSGRGFAVVATEVRALAGRSADAAKNIKDLINTAGAEVTSGVRLVSATGAALDKIVGRVGEISDRINEISAAAESQALGIDEVNAAISQIDKGTQQNAAMVEEAAAATTNLTAQAEALNRLVEAFQVKVNPQDQMQAA